MLNQIKLLFVLLFITQLSSAGGIDLNKAKWTEGKSNESTEFKLVISNDSLFVKTKDGFKPLPISDWQQSMNIFVESDKYLFGDSKIELDVVNSPPEILVLSQKLPIAGVRIFNFIEETNSVIINEVTYSSLQKEAINSGDFSSTTYVFYGSYQIKLNR